MKKPAVKRPVGRPRKSPDAPVSMPAPQAPAHPVSNPFGLLRLKQILEVVPVCKATWWNWVAQGIAPQPVRMGTRCTCWKAAEIQAFVQKMGV